jgi:UDP:flavonoid glycosyltransferase YjiC (YdhE family)
LVEREWFARLCLNATLPTVHNAVDEWSPDLIIRETCEYAAAVVADRLSLRHAQVGISTATAEAAVLLDLVTPELEDLSIGLTRRIFESPYLTKFPVSLDPSPYPTTIRFRDTERRDPHPLGDWWPGNESPLVYLTFGTMATRTDNGQELLRRVLASIQVLDIRILVTTGSMMAPEHFDVPQNVHVESWVAQGDVFAAASIVICHGGSGTTMGALAAGVPLILLPIFADQPTNATLVQKAGAGIVVGDGSESADSNSKNVEKQMALVGRAINQILTNPKFRDAANSLAHEIRGAHSLPKLVDRIVAAV